MSNQNPNTSPQQPQQQVMLPDMLSFAMPAAQAITILEALSVFGPFNRVAPVIGNFERQLLGQKLNTGYQGPVPGDPVAPPGAAGSAAAPLDPAEVDVNSDVPPVEAPAVDSSPFTLPTAEPDVVAQLAPPPDVSPAN